MTIVLALGATGVFAPITGQTLGIAGDSRIAGFNHDALASGFVSGRSADDGLVANGGALRVDGAGFDPLLAGREIDTFELVFASDALANRLNALQASGSIQSPQPAITVISVTGLETLDRAAGDQTDRGDASTGVTLQAVGSLMVDSAETLHAVGGIESGAVLLIGVGTSLTGVVETVLDAPLV